MDLCACGSLLFEIMLTFNDFLSMLLHPPLPHPEADESASCSSKVMRCRWSRWAPHRKSFLLVDGWSWITILNSSSLKIKKESPFLFIPIFWWIFDCQHWDYFNHHKTARLKHHWMMIRVHQQFSANRFSWCNTTYKEICRPATSGS